MIPAEIAIYVPEESVTTRLHYVLEWIFAEQLKIPYQVLCDQTQWQQSVGLKINYSENQLPEAQIWIKPQGLLKEQAMLNRQDFGIQRWKRITVLFYNQPGAPVPFDLFAAIFYLISRYEEYLPFQPDRHGRFPETASVAGQYQFLTSPVVDMWLYHFGEILSGKGISLPPRHFQYRITFDIDMAWKYKHRGWLRHWGGHFRDLLRLDFKGIHERTAVLQSKKEDPYFSFPVLQQYHQTHSIHPIFFLLLGEGSKYDRNIQGNHPGMQQFIIQLAKQYECGIHPSYQSHKAPEILKKECRLFADATGQAVTKSRQHFIKYTLPETYRQLIQCGIREDYSMGYASSNGYRAGTSHSFLWYDLQKEEKTTLRIYPFAFMDATSLYYLHQQPEEALKEWKKLYLTLKAIGGCFTSIWHNYILSIDSPWLEAYKEALDFAAEQGK